MARTFVMGDVHGAHKALVHLLGKVNFDPVWDTLIFLGDYADGWPETKEVVEELMGLRNVVMIHGNHDEWFTQWILTGRREHIWVVQGGQATLDSFEGTRPSGEMRQWLLRNREVYYHDADRGMLFVHGGFPPSVWDLDAPWAMTTRDEMMWDRDLFIEARNLHSVGSKKRIMPEFNEVYIGHTTTEAFSRTPARGGNVWMMDQGGGWSGYLSIMDVDTKEFWVSDRVSMYYPNIKGRG